MSLFDYRTSKQIAMEDPPFAALIMAAYRKADSGNAARLDATFPTIVDELRARYNAPGGLLADEREPGRCTCGHEGCSDAAVRS